MLEISNIEIFGFNAAIRGMRKSYGSSSKSDSLNIFSEKILTKDPEFKIHETNYFKIGENDKKLILSLVRAGRSHRKFLRLIKIQCDIKAPLYWWTEFDTYKVSTTRLSSSTMHTLGSQYINMSNFSFDVHDEWPDGKNKLDSVIQEINRSIWLYQKSNKDKKYLIRAKQLLPSSFLYDSTIDINYESFLSMYHDRINHKLDEWKIFLNILSKNCQFLKEIIGASKHINE